VGFPPYEAAPPQNTGQVFAINADTQSMKSRFVFLCLLCALAPALWAQADDTYDREVIIAEINGLNEPYIKGDFIVFTARTHSRYVGIAFDFEQFRVIHSYQKINTRDIDNEIISSIYFYVLKIPEGVDSVSYKIITDGLWSIDPLNPHTKFDSAANSVLSTVRVPRQIIPVTRVTARGNVRFVYTGESGQKIQLGGSFTNWDPFIYEMRETRPGLYECELSLLPGTHYYNFYKGMAVVIDHTNPARAYTPDGKAASVIEVR
jgi:hypothetical protein